MKCQNQNTPGYVKMIFAHGKRYAKKDTQEFRNKSCTAAAKFTKTDYRHIETILEVNHKHAEFGFALFNIEWGGNIMDERRLQNK